MNGIYLTRGCSIHIPSFTIDLTTGDSSDVTLNVGFDVYPLWLRTAITQARAAEQAAADLGQHWTGDGNEREGDLLELEMIAAMNGIVASAAAIDAFYGSVRDRCKVVAPPSSTSTKRKRGRERIITATFQQRFALKNETVASIRQPIKDIFRFRHTALHAHGRPEEPVLHPRLLAGMSRKHVIFRSENATKSATFALNLIGLLATRPHPRYPGLKEHCSFAREWLQPLIDDWETDHTPINLPRPLSEQARRSKMQDSIALAGSPTPPSSNVRPSSGPPPAA